MYCGNCNKHIAECTCPDIEERLAKLGSAGMNVASKFCKRCARHHSRCQCAEPEFVIRFDGRVLPESAVVKGANGGIGRLVDRQPMTTGSPETFTYENEDGGDRTVVTVTT